MGKGNRQRQLARQRAMRQATRREALRRKHRRQALAATGVFLSVGVIVLVLVLAGAFSGSSKKPLAASATPSPSASATSTPGTCTYTPVPTQNSAGRNPGLPPSSPVGTATQALFTTSRGGILVALDRAKAPCTVNALTYLIGKKFYDNTVCHRVVTKPTLTVLQCGDPTGTGSGGPGFSIVDENLPTAGTSASPVTYPAGTVAMANSGPNTSGSQLFFVAKDSPLPASYTVVGRIISGAANLRKITDKGTAKAGGDGPPAQEVRITTVTLK